LIFASLVSVECVIRTAWPFRLAATGGASADANANMYRPPNNPPLPERNDTPTHLHPFTATINRQPPEQHRRIPLAPIWTKSSSKNSAPRMRHRSTAEACARAKVGGTKNSSRSAKAKRNPKNRASSSATTLRLTQFACKIDVVHNPSYYKDKHRLCVRGI